jgi:RNA polymerase sigma-70 factor, ECF subfamily
LAAGPLLEIIGRPAAGINIWFETGWDFYRIIFTRGAGVMQAETADVRRERFQHQLRQDFPRVFNYVLRLVRSPEVAEDLVQEAFLKAWQAFDRFDPVRPFRPWVLQIARRTTLDWFRKHREQPLPEAWEPATSQPDPEQQAAASETAERLEYALDSLPEGQRSAALLYYMEELSLEEVAQSLGKSVRATTSLLHRARQALYRRLSLSPDPKS